MRATDGKEIDPAIDPEVKQWPNMVLPEFPWTIFTRNFGIPILMMRLLRRNVKIRQTPKEVSMLRANVTSAVAGAFLLGMATAALAVTGEYDNMCTMGLAMGKDIKTDCSINGQIGGKTYCFGSEEAKTEFMKAPEANLAKAQAYYSKKKG